MSRGEGERSGTDSGFLSRWAERKQRSRGAAEPGAVAPSDERPAAQSAPEGLTEEEVAALPDPDSLKAGDDFKPFLQRGVPEMLKRRALRRLWQVNPLFNLRDGLNDYDGDYTGAATVTANLKTLFQPGRGMPQPEPRRRQEPAEPAEPERAPAADPAIAAEGVAPAPPTASEGGEPEPASAIAEHGEGARERDRQQGALPTRRRAVEHRWGGFAVAEGASMGSPDGGDGEGSA